MNTYNLISLTEVEEFFLSLKEEDRVPILLKIRALRKDYTSVYTKTLKSPIRELKVRKYRILFGIKGNTIYLISGFLKKTQKTPKVEIEYAIKIYKQL